MELKDYITRMKMLYSALLEYIDSDDDSPESFQEFAAFLKGNDFGGNADELRTILNLISKVSKHHRGGRNQTAKLKKVIAYFLPVIKQTLSNLDLFRIFRGSRLLVLFLFDEQAVRVDEEVAYLVSQKVGMHGLNFFYPEVKRFLTKNGKYGPIIASNTTIKKDETFERKRREGENDSQICSLIREDSLEEFVRKFCEEKRSPSDEVPPSLFETHPMLIKKKATLIEYSAFFGSRRVLGYLLEHKSDEGGAIEDCDESLWLFAVCSGSAEVIHLLEEHGMAPGDGVYAGCLSESVKCHHNGIARYIASKMEAEGEDVEAGMSVNFFSSYNFEFFPQDFADYESAFENACQYDYVTIVKILLDTGKLDLREILVRKSISSENFS